VIAMTAGQQRARRTETRQQPRVVWVTTAGDDSTVEGIECVDLPTAVRRAADAVPRSFSLMLRTSALDELAGNATLNTLGRAHRIVLCEDGKQERATPAMPCSRIGFLPRPFDTEAFAGALAWLAARSPG
jgi:hypothetical protein